VLCLCGFVCVCVLWCFVACCFGDCVFVCGCVCCLFVFVFVGCVCWLLKLCVFRLLESVVSSVGHSHVLCRSCGRAWWWFFKKISFWCPVRGGGLTGMLVRSAIFDLHDKFQAFRVSRGVKSRFRFGLVGFSSCLRSCRILDFRFLGITCFRGLKSSCKF
jgi:hypothetical protein